MWSALRRLIVANPMGVFLWGIIAKWYILVAVTSLIVLYYVAKGLQEIGFIDYITRTIEDIFGTTKAIAQNCTTKLGKANWEGMVDFWNCMANPGEYQIQDDTGEVQLQQALEHLIKTPAEGGVGDGTIPEMAQPTNPYDSPTSNAPNN